ncbi:3-hydroxyisobutyryl-CoA hydrolase, mitochondrial [Aplysia californica]|uniref:3-hydroxyisobutyryl-CoA hydrolase, mitochondrial n=1 Tax=Aplysia californica TaxID=6500 RepID=A0ABM1AEK9_APLCA|nr:3-hydroxyisobutyryl-CoA hydrolase, mitochondrial [Aplysia californica]
MTDATSCSDPAAEDLLVARVGAAQFITLNRQKALNALNLRMIRRLTPQLTCWEKESSTNIVVLKAAGDKAFCSGGDLKSIYHSHQEGGHYAQHFFYEEFSLNSIIGYYKKPLVSLLNGITFGGVSIAVLLKASKALVGCWFILPFICLLFVCLFVCLLFFFYICMCF